MLFNLRESALPLLLLLALFSCANSANPDDGNPPPPVEDSFKVEKAFPNLSFQNPLELRNPGDGSNRLFVAEQRGMIYVFKNEATVQQKNVFLDIRNKIISGGERGLLGLAFHPNYAANGYFYVNYTADNPLRTVVSRFKVSANNSEEAVPSSETILLTFEQPYSNHNGGAIRFGPDGYLYIATGDGGSGGDPKNNGQSRSVLLGKILRIDVDGIQNGKNYAIPPDNPFAGNNQGFREEIYAYGLRNPFRFSFDTKTSRLWAGDVGQGQYEEIDMVEKGGNYGWNIMEGNHCYGAQSCDKSGLILPVFEYDHSVGQSITGGYVYRGSKLTQLQGRYVYADYITGRIWALDISDLQSPENTLLVDSDLNISSFGTDSNNELYICSFDGFIYQLAPK